jgi:hypothetical protein
MQGARVAPRWQPRWFVLFPDTIAWRTSRTEPAEAEGAGTRKLSLDGLAVVRADGPVGLVLEHRDREVHLRASCAGHRDGWIAAIAAMRRGSGAADGRGGGGVRSELELADYNEDDCEGPREGVSSSGDGMLTVP